MKAKTRAPVVQSVLLHQSVLRMGWAAAVTYEALPLPPHPPPNEVAAMNRRELMKLGTAAAAGLLLHEGASVPAQ